jgi:hypothetical protein
MLSFSVWSGMDAWSGRDFRENVDGKRLSTPDGAQFAAGPPAVGDGHGTTLIFR